MISKQSLTLEELSPFGRNYQSFFQPKKTAFDVLGNTFCWQEGDSIYTEAGLFLSLEILKTLDEKIEGLPQYFCSKQAQEIGFVLGNNIFKYNGCFTKYTVDGVPKNIEFSPDFSKVAYCIGHVLHVYDFLLHKDYCIENHTKAQDGGLPYRNEYGTNHGVYWSPESDRLAFYRLDESKVSNYTLIERKEGRSFPKVIKYPFTGEPNQDVKVGVFDFKTTVFLDLRKSCYHTNLVWKDGELYVTELEENKPLWTLCVYENRGNLKTCVMSISGKKYVEPENPPCFLSNGNFIILHENNLLDRDGHRLNSNEAIVTKIIGCNKDYFVYQTSTDEAMNRSIQVLNLSTGVNRIISTEKGNYEAIFNELTNEVIYQYSSIDFFKKIEKINLADNVTSLLYSEENPLKNYEVPTIEFGTISSEGEMLNYRIIKPTNFDKNKRYPAILYVYGGPHVQLVQNTWFGGAKSIELVLAQSGFVVFSLDSRGSSNRGYLFESEHYRQMGHLTLVDQFCGMQFLKDLPYVDVNRVGVHGWSFGGYMTINLMTYYSNFCKAGVAGAPVTNWALYEKMYGERYMCSPQDNKEGYGATNLSLRAQDLTGKLLIIHGEMDDTVLPKNTTDFVEACKQKNISVDTYFYSNQKHHIDGRDNLDMLQRVVDYFKENL